MQLGRGAAVALCDLVEGGDSAVNKCVGWIFEQISLSEGTCACKCMFVCSG